MTAKPILPAVAFALIASWAQAQEYVRPECLGVVQASATLKFESVEHAHWYRRFWTGSCKDLPALRCLPGSPNWNGMVGELVKRGRPDQTNLITATACRMGQTIGHEWARAKTVRRIDTDDLKAFMATLDASPDVPTGLSRVDLRVKTALAAR